MDCGLGGNFVVAKLLARKKVRSFASGNVGSKVRIAPDDDEARITSRLRIKQPNVCRIDLLLIRPRTNHKIGESLNIGGPLNEDRKVVLAMVEPTIAWMTDRCDDKTCVRQRCRSIVVGTEPSAPPMREDDKRKVLTDNRAILRAGDC